jgi:flagellar assembly protein FliH
MNTDEQDEEMTAWELPYVEDTQKLLDTTTNAFKYKSDWKYEPPEEEVEILPPTAQELEAMQTAAQDEGFAKGQQEGHTKGYAEGLAQGQEEGLALGLEEGTKQGLETAKEQIEIDLLAWRNLIDSLQAPVSKVEQKLEKELVLLAVSLARSVIRCEVTTNQDLIFQALSEGLKTLPIQEDLYQIHLNPSDLSLVTNHFSPEEISQHKWQLIASPELSAGGCEIVTKTNAVDVSVERRVKDVLDKFLLEQGLSQVFGSDE